MEVLRAKLSDLNWIADELNQFHASLSTKSCLIPPTQAALQAELSAMHADHVLLVAWDDGDRVGTIGCLSASYPYNPGVSLQSARFLWVPEQDRGTQAG